MSPVSTTSITSLRNGSELVSGGGGGKMSGKMSWSPLFTVCNSQQ